MLKKFAVIGFAALGSLAKIVNVALSKEPEVLNTLEHIANTTKASTVVTMYKIDNAISIAVTNDNYAEALKMLTSSAKTLLEQLKAQGVSHEIYEQYLEAMRKQFESELASQPQSSTTENNQPNAPPTTKVEPTYPAAEAPI